MNSQNALQRAFTMEIAYLIEWLDEPLQKVTNNPSKENIDILLGHLKRISLKELSNIQTFLLLPAEYHLRQLKVSDSVKCHLFEYLTFIVTKTQIVNNLKYESLFALSFFHLYEFKNPSQPADTSEELKIAVFTFINKLMKSITFDKKELYTPKNIPKIGQALFITTKIIRNERSYQVRLKGVKCIAKLTLTDRSSDSFPKDLLKLLSQALKMILPGLTTTLHSIIKQADIQQHKLTKECLLSWARLIVLTLKDEKPTFVMQTHYNFELNKKTEESNSEPLNFDSQSLSAEMIQNLIKDREMPSSVMSTSDHLRVRLNDLTPLVSHSHPEVREVIARTASLLVIHCTKNLGSSLLPLLEALLVLQEDQVPSVVTTAIEALDLIKNHLNNTAGETDSLLDFLEEGFLNHVIALPRLVIAIDIEEQNRPLYLLRGYASVLGPGHLVRILSFSQNCQRFLSSLVAAFHLDSSNVYLIASILVIDLKTTHDYRSRQWLKFVHLNANDVDILIDKVLERFICSAEMIDHLLDEIIDYYKREHFLRAEISIIINAICRSRHTNQDQLLTILELYLDPANWQQVSPNEDSTEGNRMRVLEGCIQVEGLGAIGASLGGTASAHLLIRILTAILERAGSSISLFSLAGRQALEKLADEGFGCTISELLTKSAQHLSCVLGTRIRREKDHLRVTATLEILTITLRFAGKKTLCYFKQAVNDVIDKSISSNARATGNDYLRVLKSLVQRLREWFFLNNPNESEENKEKDELEDINYKISVIDQLNEYHKNKVVSANFKEIEDEEKDQTTEHTKNELNQNEEGEEEEEKKISDPLTDLLEAITRRCIHYLPSKNKSNRLQALETLEITLPLLYQNCKSDVYLPIVHSIWPCLVSVFHHNTDQVLIRIGWSILLILVRTSKTFVSSRILKEIWPDILKFLSNSNSNFDETSQHFKLRMSLLNDIPFFVSNLSFNEKEFNNILKTCLPYLETRHPRKIQEASKTFYERLAKVNRENVWLFLINYNKSIEFNPPSTCPELISFKVCAENETQKFGNNVDIILKHIS